MLYEVSNGLVYTAAIQFSAAHHCNLRCAHCSHLSPFVPPRLPSLQAFAADLRRLSQVLRARTIVLLGGEPLLNPDLAEMARLARESGIARTVTVTTNGLLLGRMRQEFWRHVDVVRVSLYPGSEPSPETLDAVAGRAREHGTQLIVDRIREFRTPTVTEPHPMDLTTRLIFATCGVAHRQHCHMFSDGWLYKCSMPVNLPGYLPRLGINRYDPATDGLHLHGDDDLLTGLKRYLFSPRPLEACRYCLGWLGTRQPHRLLSKQELADPALTPVTRAGHLDRARALYALARCAKWATVDKYLTRPARP